VRAGAQLNLFFVRSHLYPVILSYQHILIVFGKLEYLDKAAGAGGGSWGWLHYFHQDIDFQEYKHVNL